MTHGEEQHVCQAPSTNPEALKEAGLVADDDWTCPVCGTEWWLDFNVCLSCMRSGDPEWRRYPTEPFDPSQVTATRGGIQFRPEGD